MMLKQDLGALLLVRLELLGALLLLVELFALCLELLILLLVLPFNRRYLLV